MTQLIGKRLEAILMLESFFLIPEADRTSHKDSIVQKTINNGDEMKIIEVFATRYVKRMTRRRS